MEKRKILEKKEGRSEIMVFENTFKNGNKNWNVVLVNTSLGIEFGDDCFDSKIKLNNYLKRFKLKC